jgi:hypothetical protein
LLPIRIRLVKKQSERNFSKSSKVNKEVINAKKAAFTYNSNEFLNSLYKPLTNRINLYNNDILTTTTNAKPNMDDHDKLDSFKEFKLNASPLFNIKSEHLDNQLSEESKSESIDKSLNSKNENNKLLEPEDFEIEIFKPTVNYLS